MLERWIKNEKLADILEFVVVIAGAWLAYQGLGLALGTQMPMVSVVSTSMVPTLNVGDLILVAAADYKVGDIIVFNAPGVRQGPIIHRIIAVNGDGTLQTKGDNNPGQLPYERSIAKSQIIGKARLALPLLGYPRLALFALGI
jgi:signal peptidase